MELTKGLRKTRGRPPIEKIPLPPHVQRALTLRGNGSSWKVAAEAVGMDYRTLRKYVRDHPDAADYIQTAIESNLGESHSKFADAAPKLAKRLIELGLSKDVRAYAQITAISECFKILQQGIVDKQNKEELAKIREALDALEGGKAPEVIDVGQN